MFVGDENNRGLSGFDQLSPWIQKRMKAEIKAMGIEISPVGPKAGFYQELIHQDGTDRGLDGISEDMRESARRILIEVYAAYDGNRTAAEEALAAIARAESLEFEDLHSADFPPGFLERLLGIDMSSKDAQMFSDIFLKTSCLAC